MTGHMAVVLSLVFFLVFSVIRLEAGTYENEVISVQYSDSNGIYSWRLKKYDEDFFNVEVASDDKEKSWNAAGIRFGRLPGNRDISIGCSGKLENNILSTETLRRNNTAVLYMRDPTGRALPKGLNVQIRLVFGGRYMAKIYLTVENETKSRIDLDDGKNGGLYLYAFPMFRTAAYQTETVVKQPEQKAAAVSPSSGLTVLDGDFSWIGLRSQYYAFGLRETSAVGKFVHRKVKTLERPLAGDSGSETNTYTSVLVGWKFGWNKLRPREKLEAVFEIYLGPKNEDELSDTQFHDLFNTWDGITGPIGKLMFALLKFLEKATNSYGLSILLLTVIVKLFLHPLNRKQMVAMKKMQALQPRINELKKKIKDSAKLNMELQKLFQENQVNPLGGCFPLLLQLPIFIALYTCLSNAIELKGASFMWLSDLSQPDHTLILPLFFSISMYYSSKMTSAGDPAQESMMKIMPIAMFFIFMRISSGVMLYITGQSVFSFFEQQYNRLILEKAEATAGPGSAGKKP